MNVIVLPCKISMADWQEKRSVHAGRQSDHTSAARSRSVPVMCNFHGFRAPSTESSAFYYPLPLHWTLAIHLLGRVWAVTICSLAQLHRLTLSDLDSRHPQADIQLSSITTAEHRSL